MHRTSGVDVKQQQQQQPASAAVANGVSSRGAGAIDFDMNMASLRNLFNIPSSKQVELQQPKVISKASLCRSVVAPALYNKQQTAGGGRPTTWSTNHRVAYNNNNNNSDEPNTATSTATTTSPAKVQVVRVVRRKTDDPNVHARNPLAKTTLPAARKRPAVAVASSSDEAVPHSRRLQQVPSSLAVVDSSPSASASTTSLDILADLAISRSGSGRSSTAGAAVSSSTTTTAASAAEHLGPPKKRSPNVLKSSPSSRVKQHMAKLKASPSQPTTTDPDHHTDASPPQANIGYYRQDDGSFYELIPVPYGVLLSPSTVKSFGTRTTGADDTDDRQSVRSASTLSAHSPAAMADVDATPTKLPSNQQITLDMDCLIRPISPDDQAAAPVAEFYAAGFTAGIEFFRQQRHHLKSADSSPKDDYGVKLDEIIESVMHQASSCVVEPSTSTEVDIEETVRLVASQDYSPDWSKYDPFKDGAHMRLKPTSEDAIVDVIDSVVDKTKQLVASEPTSPNEQFSSEQERIKHFQALYNQKHWQRTHKDHHNSARTRPFIGFKNPWMAEKMASKILKQRVSPSNISEATGQQQPSKRKQQHQLAVDDHLDDIISQVRQRVMGKQGDEAGQKEFRPKKRRRPITTKMRPKDNGETCARCRVHDTERAARCRPYEGRCNDHQPFYFMKHPERKKKYRPRVKNTIKLDGQESRRLYSLAPSLPLEMQYTRFMRGARAPIYLDRSKIHGIGVFAREPIDVGTLLLEYCGEVIRNTLVDKREQYYRSKGIGTYMFNIDSQFTIDATLKATVARFVNHSCDPNCQAKVVSTDGGKKIVLYASQFIPQQTELSYNYKLPFEQDKLPCHCGAVNCKKFLN